MYVLSADGKLSAVNMLKKINSTLVSYNKGLHKKTFFSSLFVRWMQKAVSWPIEVLDIRRNYLLSGNYQKNRCYLKNFIMRSIGVRLFVNHN